MGRRHEPSYILFDACPMQLILPNQEVSEEGLLRLNELLLSNNWSSIDQEDAVEEVDLED